MKNRRMTLSQSSSLWEVCGFDKAITFIGAGGKTTSVKKLGDEIASQGYPVVLTTTTKVYPDQFRSTWESNEKAPPLDVAYPCFWYGGYHIETGKWIGPALESIDREIVQSNKSFFNKDQTDAARLLQ